MMTVYETTESWIKSNLLKGTRGPSGNAYTTSRRKLFFFLPVIFCLLMFKSDENVRTVFFLSNYIAIQVI